LSSTSSHLRHSGLFEITIRRLSGHRHPPRKGRRASPAHRTLCNPPGPGQKDCGTAPPCEVRLITRTVPKLGPDELLVMSVHPGGHYRGDACRDGSAGEPSPRMQALGTAAKYRRALVPAPSRRVRA
jgi:hypothetical protein